jgi:hypothetical protein
MEEPLSNHRERIVHLGLLLPKFDRDPNTIYCILTQVGNLIGMQINSEQEYEVPNAVPSKKIGPYQRTLRAENIDIQISELAITNNAVIQDYCRKDGLELKAILSNPRRDLRTDCSSKA